MDTKSTNTRISIKINQLTQNQVQDQQALQRLNQLRQSEGTPEQTIPPLSRLSTWSASSNTQDSDGGVSRFRSHFPSFNQNGVVRFLASMFGAVTVGLFFGFIVLTVFMQEQVPQAPIAESVAQPEESKGADATDNPATPAPVSEQPAGIPVAIQLPEQSFQMVQAGAFSDLDAAEAAIVPLDQEGLPHMVHTMNGNQHVFVAAGTSRDDVLGLATFFKEKEMDVFVRELTIAAFQQEVRLETAANKSSLHAFFLNGFDITKKLAAFSGTVLGDGKAAKPLDKETEAKLTDMHRRFLDDSRIAQNAMPKELKPYINQMITGLNQAMTAMRQMKTSNAASYAWQVQKGVLIYLENYALWVKKTDPA